MMNMVNGYHGRRSLPNSSHSHDLFGFPVSNQLEQSKQQIPSVLNRRSNLQQRSSTFGLQEQQYHHPQRRFVIYLGHRERIIT